eukprot:scaffold90584_cov30-Prasinocladus_malaysianus.AAC.1
MARLANPYDGMWRRLIMTTWRPRTLRRTARCDVEAARSEASQGQVISAKAEGEEGDPSGNDDPNPAMALVKATNLDFHHKFTLCGTSKAVFDHGALVPAESGHSTIQIRILEIGGYTILFSHQSENSKTLHGRGNKGPHGPKEGV